MSHTETMQIFWTQETSKVFANCKILGPTQDPKWKHLIGMALGT